MGAMIGAAIAAIAMIINSVLTTYLGNYVENQKEKRASRKRKSEEVKVLYESAIHWLDKLIRCYGLATEEEWQDYNKIVHKINLFASESVTTKFNELECDITNWAHELPELPKIFIRKFEDDSERWHREEEIAKAKQKREKAARKKRPKLRKQFNELIELIKNEMKNAE